MEIEEGHLNPDKRMKKEVWDLSFLGGGGEEGRRQHPSWTAVDGGKGGCGWFCEGRIGNL